MEADQPGLDHERQPFLGTRRLGRYRGWPELSSADRDAVLDQIFFEGPELVPYLSRYATLMVLSVIIAALGLVGDSTAAEQSERYPARKGLVCTGTDDQRGANPRPKSPRHQRAADVTAMLPHARMIPLSGRAARSRALPPCQTDPLPTDGAVAGRATITPPMRALATTAPDGTAAEVRRR